VSPATSSGRETVLHELVLANLDVAGAIARRYTGRSGFGDDLEQAANVALVKAARDFVPDRGHDFLAYAIPCMTGAVKRFFRDSAWTVRPPRPVQERHVEHRGLSRHVADGIEVETCIRPWRLDVPAPGDEVPLGAMLVDPRDQTWELAEIRLDLWQQLRQLSPRARQILHLRFVEDLTQQEIADRLGVSQYHVSRLLARYLGELRARMTEGAAAA
jgi:RNA polymerase sigma-B factor